MSHLDPQQEDTDGVTSAKEAVVNKLYETPRQKEIVAMLEAVLDDRSNMVAALFAFRDSATDVLFVAAQEDQSTAMKDALKMLDASITDAERALFINQEVEIKKC